MTTTVILSVDQVPIDLLARDLRLPATMTLYEKEPAVKLGTS
jgi:hypothetical protein